MGIIQRQSIKRSLVAYIGVGIGAVSSLFIYPLELEIYGLAQFLVSLAWFIVPLSTLGIRTLTVRFFPHFKNEDNYHNGFLGFLMSASLVALICFGSLAFLFRDQFLKLLAFLNFNVSLYTENIMVIVALVLVLVFLDLFTAYSSNFRRVVIPEVFSSLFLKLSMPILVVLYYFGYLHKQPFTWGLVVVHIIMALGVALYIRYLGQWSWSLPKRFFNKALRLEMINYAIFGILALFGSTLAFRIDSIMVTSLINEESNGIYIIAMFITNIMVIPFAAINSIAAPIIAENWKAKNLEEIDSIYKKSSLTLLITGLFLFGFVSLAIDDIMRLSTNYEKLVLAKNVVYTVGLAKVIDMSFGVNNQIISFSERYRFNLYAILVLGFTNIGLNFWFIPIYGITGAGLATAISLASYNLLKYGFIYWRFGLQPFTRATVWTLVITLIAATITWIIPKFGIPLLDIALVGTIFSLLYVIPVLYFRLSPDINSLVEKYWGMARAILFK